jgi:hypothetical protein
MEKLIKEFAKLLNGLNVPVSMGTPIGTARETYSNLRGELKLVGWTTDEEVEEAIKRYLAKAAEESVEQDMLAHLRG